MRPARPECTGWRAFADPGRLAKISWTPDNLAVFATRSLQLERASPAKLGGKSCAF
jgi:hypothetical protein